MIGLVGFGILMITIAATKYMQNPTATMIPLNQRPEAHIGIEHEGPLAITLELSTNGKSGLLSIEQSADIAIALSLPKDWKRGEVQGAALTDVSAEEVTFGFRRWSLPSKTIVTFEIPITPNSIKLHNPSLSPLKVDLTIIDLLSSDVQRRTFLMQEGPVDLW